MLGGIVQDDDREVREEYPGQREPLPLPAGQLRAVLADRRGQPGGKGRGPLAVRTKVPRWDFSGG